MPIKVKRSAIKLDLTFKSTFEVTANDGERLTSINHGLSFSSINISNPKSSKQLFLYGMIFSYALNSLLSIDMTVFTMMSSILLNNCFESIFYFSK